MPELLAGNQCRPHACLIGFQRLVKISAGPPPRRRVIVENHRMIRVAVIRPDPPGAREPQLLLLHFHARVIGSDHLRLKQQLLGRRVERLQQIRTLCASQPHIVCREISTPCRAKICCCRCNGK